MIEVEHVLKQDRYLAPHTAFWMRELHILAYKQFLDSCKYKREKKREREREQLCVCVWI
jgi:hypothetical protein